MYEQSLDKIRPPAEEPRTCPELDRIFADRSFYARVQQNRRRGLIVAHHMAGEWHDHLENLTELWSPGILKTGLCRGRRVPSHMKLRMAQIWFGHFRETARNLCDPNVAVVFIDRAERITAGLKFVMFLRLPQASTAQGQIQCE